MFVYIYLYLYLFFCLSYLMFASSSNIAYFIYGNNKSEAEGDDNDDETGIQYFSPV